MLIGDGRDLIQEIIMHMQQRKKNQACKQSSLELREVSHAGSALCPEPAPIDRLSYCYFSLGRSLRARAFGRNLAQRR